uniref:Uncharacterized protein n=1 Tax=Acrobeloides nanus TaxID=290746 RepID=A0A914ERV5_9BILA
MPRRACAPYCKLPEKRDFMDINPERSEEDFYRNYDPMVGIGTALILLLFACMITIKSLIRWAVRHWRIRQYKRTHPEGLIKRPEKEVTFEIEKSTTDSGLEVGILPASGRITLNGRIS